MLFNTEIDICIKIDRSRTFCKITNIKIAHIKKILLHSIIDYIAVLS